MTGQATAADHLLSQAFAAFASEPSGSGAMWLDQRRERALRNFRLAGIPHRRVEEWKYTDLRAALDAPQEPALADHAPGPLRDPFAAITGPRLVMNDGCFDWARSKADSCQAGIDVFDLATAGEMTPDWVKRNFGEVLAAGAMEQASLALMRGGLAMRVAAPSTIPVHLHFLHGASAVHGRVLIVVEEGASLVLLESHGGHSGISNLGMEIVLKPHAQMTHLRLAEAAPDAVQIEVVGIRVGRDARYQGHFSQKGARLSRLELWIWLHDKGAEAELSGASVLSGRLHADVTTRIDHVAGNTGSRQLFKHVAGGNSRTVYQGKITVRKGANGSDSRQTAKALLLGARAEADLKPELEILADDVKCAHGAAVGDLDADSLFYLRSRGLGEGEARSLLVRAFLQDAVAEVAREDARAAIWDFVESGLVEALGAQA